MDKEEWGFVAVLFVVIFGIVCLFAVLNGVFASDRGVFIEQSHSAEHAGIVDSWFVRIDRKMGDDRCIACFSTEAEAVVFAEWARDFHGLQ